MVWNFFLSGIWCRIFFMEISQIKTRLGYIIVLSSKVGGNVDLFWYYLNFWKIMWVGNPLTLSWRRPLSYRNQSVDLLRKSMDWFLYDNGLLHERVNIHIRVLTELATDSVLKNFVNFTGKQLCWCLFLIRFQTWEPATSLKRGSNTSVLLWNLGNI